MKFEQAFALSTNHPDPEPLSRTSELQRTMIMNARVPENDEGNGNEPVPPTANDLANAFRTLLGDREMCALLRTAMNSSPEPLQTLPPRHIPSSPPTSRLS